MDDLGVLNKKGIEKYDGLFSKNKYNGLGKLKEKTGLFEGEFQQGRKHGKGKAILNNGTEVICNWRFGKPFGKGTIVNKTTGETKEGMWKDGKFIPCTVKVSNHPQQTASPQNYDWEQVVQMYGQQHDNWDQVGQVYGGPLIDPSESGRKYEMNDYQYQHQTQPEHDNQYNMAYAKQEPNYGYQNEFGQQPGYTEYDQNFQQGQYQHANPATFNQEQYSDPNAYYGTYDGQAYQYKNDAPVFGGAYTNSQQHY